MKQQQSEDPATDEIPDEAAKLILRGLREEAVAAIAGESPPAWYGLEWERWRKRPHIKRAYAKLTPSQRALMAEICSRDPEGRHSADGMAVNFDVPRTWLDLAAKLQRKKRRDLLWEVAKGRLSLKQACARDREW